MLSGQTDDALAEAIVGTIHQPLLVLDGDLTVRVANAAFLRRFEVTREQTERRPVYELGNGEWNIPELRRLLEEVLNEDDGVEDYRIEHDFERIGRRVMLLNAHRMRRAGEPDRILLAITDKTDCERLIDELKGHKEFGDKLIDSVRESLLVLGWDLRVVTANQPFYDQFQVSAEDSLGRLVYELGNGQWDIPELRKLLEDGLPENNAFDDFEVEQEFEHIGRRVMLLNARRLDHIDKIVLAIRDVTEKRAQETRRETLMGELQHRIRNILSNVNVLAGHTARSSADLQEFMDAFATRLQGLARAQDLLAQAPSEPVALLDIVRTELEAVGARDGREFTADGPAVRLPPKDAQPIAMAVHELTTNAAKHGALKAEQGRVEIAWTLETREGERHVVFRWRERDVEIADTKPRKSFGWQVIEEHLPYMLGGTADVALHRDGLACEIVFPLPA